MICRPFTVLLWLTLGGVSWGDQLAILPGSIALTGPEARQQLVIEKVRDGQFAGQLTNQFEILSSDPSIVRVENGAAIPVGNGRATLRVRAGRQSASA